ncbi:MAG TPA: restriction endonuclease subunit S [Clostridia bacterium]|nr:restriction endonuclease subunit S [Clostridia bacterium]
MATNFKWQTKKLSGLAEFRNGVNYNKESFGEGVKVVGVSDFQDYTKPRYDELDQINPDGIVTERNILRNGDIVFVRSNGNRELIGRSLFIENPPEDITHSAFTIRLRFVSSEVYPKFYAYCFRTRLIRQGLTAQGGGTNISNLNQDILNGLEVPFPPLPTQQRIAAVLSAYDDLIENCQRRIKILEQMARGLYREWFVKFRFPNHAKTPLVDSPMGKIPKGWEVKSIGDIAEEMRRGVPKGELDAPQPFVGLEHIPRRAFALDNWETVCELGSNKLLFKKGEVLFGKIRPYFHKVSVAPFDGVCSADAIVLRPYRKEHDALMVALVTSDEFVAHATATSNGSKMPRANWNVLENYPIAVPDEKLLCRFSALFSNTVAEQQSLVFRIQNLRKTRDLLLPRLLSGQVNVN